MADELTVNVAVDYSDDNGVTLSQSVVDLILDSGAQLAHRGSQTIAITETGLNFGGVTPLGLVCIINRDQTNYVELKTAASGTIFAKLRPGGIALFEVGSGVTAPVAIANSVACVVDVFVAGR